MDKIESEKKDKESTAVSAQLRGETMAYAAQSAIYNLSANFFEPYINYRVQKYYSQHNPSHPSAGNYTQNLGGELAGDIIGASTLMLAEALCPEQLHACTRTMRGWVDPFYTVMAHKVLAKEKNSPDYEQKVEDWKTFQERNLVRSTIIATAGIASNIATQKMLIGNPSPTKLIFAGKLLSTTITTAIGLTARFAFPEQMNGVDRWIGKNIFSPFMKEKRVPSEQSSPTSHAERIANQEKNEPGLNIG